MPFFVRTFAYCFQIHQKYSVLFIWLEGFGKWWSMTPRFIWHRWAKKKCFNWCFCSRCVGFLFLLFCHFFVLVSCFFVFIISSFWFLVKQSLLWCVWLTHSTHIYLNSEKENKTFFEVKLKNFQQGRLIHASVT